MVSLKLRLILNEMRNQEPEEIIYVRLITSFGGDYPMISLLPNTVSIPTSDPVRGYFQVRSPSGSQEQEESQKLPRTSKETANDIPYGKTD